MATQGQTYGTADDQSWVKPSIPVAMVITMPVITGVPMAVAMPISTIAIAMAVAPAAISQGLINQHDLAEQQDNPQQANDLFHTLSFLTGYGRNQADVHTRSCKDGRRHDDNRNSG